MQFNSQYEYETHLNNTPKETRDKPVVRYVPQKVISGSSMPPILGKRYGLCPIDHPNIALNGKLAYTSPVESFDGDGNIVTRNTVYVLAV
jgi:hypothetical protein